MVDISKEYLAEHRFGYGPLKGNVQMGAPVETMLLDQLKPRKTADFSGVDAGLALAAKLHQLNAAAKTPQTDEEKNKTNQQIDSLYVHDVATRVSMASKTDRPFFERLVWFWNNHLTVSGTKRSVLPLLGAYEHEAIRPNVSGYFSAMLKAAIKHPAMLLYLDNQNSVSEDKIPLLKKLKPELANEKLGFNGTIGRQLLDAYTLGPDSGYTKEDAANVTRMFTGWTVSFSKTSAFAFVPKLHDDTPLTVLGKAYTKSGQAQGESLLDDLAKHPSTARYIAFRLAQYFIADEPPESVVTALTDAYLGSGGYLPRVYEALLQQPQAWQQDLAKIKMPYDYIVSVLRLFPEYAVSPETLPSTLEVMGQKPWFAPSSHGWPDTMAAWVKPELIWKRVEWANQMADQLEIYAPNANNTIKAGYGPMFGPGNRTQLDLLPYGAQAVSLLLLSPEFLKR